MLPRRKFLAASLIALFSIVPVRGDGPRSIGTVEFDTLHRMLKPQSGESRWMEIDWYPNVWEARRKAAAEGKPILLWAGSGGAPAAGC
jgi:hypothetical protein